MNNPEDRENSPSEREIQGALARLWPQLLEHPDAAGPLDALLSHPQAASLVRALPAQDLFLLIKHQGLGEATDLLGLASAEQVRTFLDLDGWKRERPELQAIAPWLQALLAAAPESFAATFDALDLELQALVLLGLVRVHPVEDPDDELPGGPDVFYVTADRTFVLELREPALLELAEGLLRAKEEQLGPLGLSTFLATMICELPSALEDEAGRWRQGRLADLGFPPYDESLALYSPLPPDELRRAGAGPICRAPEAGLPRWLARREAGPKLTQAVARLDPELALRVEQDLVYLANGLLVASSVDPGDGEAVQTVLARARGYLEIALELLGGTDPERAALLLRRFALRYLFRFTATGLALLRRRAHRLAGDAGRHALVDQAWLAGLQQLPPRLPDGGEFVRPEQIALAEAELAWLEDVRRALAGDQLLAGIPAGATALAAFGTALAHRVLDGDTAGAGGPLPEAEARRFLGQAFAAGQLLPEVRQLAATWLGAVLQDERRGQALAERWCAALQEELGGLDPTVPLDPRFVGLLLERQG